MLSPVQQIRFWRAALVDVFYPNTCQICHTELLLNEKYVCFSCAYDLPYIAQGTNELQKLNQLFWNRVQVEQVFSLLNYQRGNPTQELLHRLKYGNRTRLGVYFGGLLGGLIPENHAIELILPVPLHPKKLRQRGYNQSQLIAEGISRRKNIPIQTNCLVRKKYNRSQTQFSKFDRWQNVRSVFDVKRSHKLKNKHVLLVDDVLTTGATLEACISELLKIKNCTVSIATLAARM